MDRSKARTLLFAAMSAVLLAGCTSSTREVEIWVEEVKARPAPPPEPGVTLTPEEQREADERSQEEAASLMARLTRKSGEPTQDR